MALKITILGCGSSGGVPRIGNDWGACDPNNPKNRRMRCSIFVEKFKPSSPNKRTRILVDTSPDLRMQFLNNNLSTLDGVCMTHTHADHINGIDDLRVVFFNRKGIPIKIYMSEFSNTRINERFGYVFKTPHYENYPPFLTSNIIKEFEMFEILGEGGIMKVMPILQYHGMMNSYGFRFENMAYANDLISLPDESFEHYQNLEVLIIDALRYKKHPTHINVDQALELISKLKPKRSIITNMHIDLDYEIFNAELPDNIEPAYDGMSFTI